MHDQDLIADLQRFGIDGSSFRALPLLPLCQVAWADGTVQPEERDLILRLAKEQFDPGEEGLRALENWLTFPPTHAHFVRGHDLLVELVRRRGRVSLQASTLEEVLALAQDVAASAGGLWGFGKVAREEREALSTIAEALHLPPYASWEEVADDPGSPPVDVSVAYHPAQEGRAGTGGALRRPHEEAERCPIPADGLTIGRARSNTVQVMESATVSRTHCRVWRNAENGRFYARDLGSTTGTRVNGERVLERRLFGVETLEVGGVEFVFELDVSP